jgi:hypothetical protein
MGSSSLFDFVCFSLRYYFLTGKSIGRVLLLVKEYYVPVADLSLTYTLGFSILPYPECKCLSSAKKFLSNQMRILFPTYFLNGENDDKNKTFPMYRMPDLHGDLLLAAFRRKYHEAISHPYRGRLAEGAGDQRLPGL